MTHEEFKKALADIGHEDTIVFDNPEYDCAVVGVSEEGRLIYDFNKMVEHLMECDKMSQDDAVEFIEYNTIRAIPYAGSMAPIIMYDITEML